MRAGTTSQRAYGASLKDREFASLTVLECVRDPGIARHEIWRCVCKCGQMREVSRRSLIRGSVYKCRTCAGQREKQEDNLYLRDYREFRASFTDEQRARYEEILDGRVRAWDFRVQAEAVEQVLMERDLGGACCAKCARSYAPGSIQ